jgi:hypothetical protein
LFGGLVLVTQEHFFSGIILFRQRWRMAINRSASNFSVIQAGLFPIIHMGRPWLAYWVLPIPDQFGSLWVIRHYFGMYLQSLRIFLFH